MKADERHAFDEPRTRAIQIDTITPFHVRNLSNESLEIMNLITSRN